MALLIGLLRLGRKVSVLSAGPVLGGSRSVAPHHHFTSDSPVQVQPTASLLIFPSLQFKCQVGPNPRINGANDV
eukprot:scaffold529785_cov42-Prasinocladus_malaysianus.AAC.1